MKNVIRKYIERLTIQDIINFTKKNNYNIPNNEVNIIYKYIKNYWEDILNDNNEILNNLKKEVSPSTYLEVMKLLNKYKKFIN